MKYDQNENCAKCGYPGKTVQYTRPKGVPTVDWLTIICTRCGFQWLRECLDEKKS